MEQASLFDPSAREQVLEYGDFAMQRGFYAHIKSHDERMRVGRAEYASAIAAGEVREPTWQERFIRVARRQRDDGKQATDARAICKRYGIDYKASEWDYLDIGMKVTP